MTEVKTLTGAERKMREYIAANFPKHVFLGWHEIPHIVQAFRTDGEPPPQFGAVAYLESTAPEITSANDSTKRGGNRKRRFIVRVSLVGRRMKHSAPRAYLGAWIDRRPASAVFPESSNVKTKRD